MALGAGAARQADAVELEAWSWGALCLCLSYNGPMDAAVAAGNRAFALIDDDSAFGTDVAGYSLSDAMLWHTAGARFLHGQLDYAREFLDRAVACFRVRPMAEWHSLALSMYVQLVDRCGEESGLDHAREAAALAQRMAEDSANIGAVVKARLSVGVGELLAGKIHPAVDTLTRTLDDARRGGSGLMDEAYLLANLARAQLAAGDSSDARRNAAEAVTVAHRQGARVVEAFAHLTQAQILRQAARGDADLAAARHAVAAGLAVAEASQAHTYAAFLAEERALLDGGDLAPVAAGYEAIGATGHARRVRG